MAETSMFDYIEQTEDTLLNNIDNREIITENLVDYYLEKDYKGVCIVASGSSYNGSLCARYFMRHYLKQEVKVITPFTYLNHEHDYMEHYFTMCISQSGCSTNTLECLKLLKKEGKDTIALVGREDCDAKQYADLLVNWQVGEEKVGFVTKGVTSLALFLMLFALEASLKQNIISDEEYSKVIDDLTLASHLQGETVKETVEKYKANKEDIIAADTIYLCSSGACLGVAVEGALKISETNCINAHAVEAEEFLHGPIYPANPNSMIILIDNNEDVSTQRISDIAQAVKTITKKVYFIGNHSPLSKKHSFMTSQQSDSLTSPLYKLTVIQTLAYLRTKDTNNFLPCESLMKYKQENKVASKSRANLYTDIRKL